MDLIDGDKATLQNLSPDIWAEILSYLPYSDIKQSRLVCRCMADAANAFRLMEKSKLIVTAENREIIMKYLDDENNVNFMQFWHLELNYQKPSKDMICLLDKIGKNVRTLVLNKSPLFRFLNGRLPNLSRLAIGSRYLHSVDHAGSATSSDGSIIDLNGFPQLKSLEIVRELSYVAKNRLLWQLTGDFTMLQLENLEVELTASQEARLMSVLTTHADTLRFICIHLDDAPAQSLDSWREVWQQMTQLRSITLRGSCPSDWLENVFYSLPDHNILQNIDLSRIFVVNDMVLALITRKWPTTVQRLDLTNCPLLTDTGLCALAELHNNLRDLNVSSCRSIGKRGLLTGIANTRNIDLQRLNLSEVTNLDEDTLCQLASHLPNLVELQLDCCPRAVTEKALGHVFHHVTALQKFVLDDCVNVCDKGLIGNNEAPWPISRLVSLRSLSLRRCYKITDISLLYGFKFPDLHQLDLELCYKITDQGIKQLVTNCPAVVDLSLNGCALISDGAVLMIAQGLKRLEKLNVSYCYHLTEESLNSIAKHCSCLRELHLYGLKALRSSEQAKNIAKKLVNIKYYST